MANDTATILSIDRDRPVDAFKQALVADAAKVQPTALDPLDRFFVPMAHDPRHEHVAKRCSRGARCTVALLGFGILSLGQTDCFGKATDAVQRGPHAFRRGGDRPLVMSSNWV